MTYYRKIYHLLTRRQRKHAMVLLALMFVGMVLETLGVGLVVPAIALLTKPDLGASYPMLQPALDYLGDPSQNELIVGGMLTLVGVYLFKTLFLGFLVWQQNRFAFSVQANLSQRVFTTYLRQPYTFHLQRNSAQLIRNAVEEVRVFTGNAIAPTLVILTESMVLVGVGTLLIVMEPVGALVVAILFGGASLAVHRVTKDRVTRWGAARQIHEGLRLQHLQQGLGGAKDVKLLGREAEFLRVYSVHNAASAKLREFQVTLKGLPRLWLEFLAVAGFAALVLSMLAQGENMTTVVPTVGLFAAAAFRLMPSVNHLLGAVNGLRFGRPVINVLHEELKLSAPKPAKKSGPVMPFQREIRLSNLRYSYPGAHDDALDGVSLTVLRGESVGIIGSSGAGKSTLVDVLLGLLTPDSGEVAVDGVDIQSNLRAWQDQIGYVPQTIYLTDDTLSRNIAFGLADEQIDEAAVQAAIAAAQLQEFVASLPARLDTVVGERGVRLSGGQRQRIGIARALYHDPAVLVLDEATSALDIVTEEGVMQAVSELQGTRTLIIVSHRMSTVSRCDRVYHIDRGRMLEDGNAPKASGDANRFSRALR